MTNNSNLKTAHMKAKYIACALGGHMSGSQRMAHCPSHRDRTASLSIGVSDEGRVLVHCFAGCSQHDVISALTGLGLWHPSGNLPSQRSRQHKQDRITQLDPGRAAKTEAALGLWNSAIPVDGTLAADYLASRGLTLPPPPAIRFHPGLKHPSGGTWPCMIALVMDGVDGTPRAVHRTFLALDGNGKAPVDPAKMMLGPCRGGAVRLGEPKTVLMVGEGIETCLAGSIMFGKPAWAALSATGMAALDLPKNITEVLLLVDGDDSGESAAQRLRSRLLAAGRLVQLMRAPRGKDFNDVLIARSSAQEGRSDER